MAARSPASRATVGKVAGRVAAMSARLPSPLASRVTTFASRASTRPATPLLHRRIADHQRGPGVADEIVQLVEGVGGVQRQEDRAGPDRRQVKVQVLGAFLDLHRHPVAGLQVGVLLEPRGYRGAVLVDFGEGQGAAHVREGGLVGVFAAGILEQMQDGRIDLRIDLAGDTLRVLVFPEIRLFHRGLQSRLGCPESTVPPDVGDRPRPAKSARMFQGGQLAGEP